MPEITVAICTRDRLAFLQRALASLLTAEWPADAELLVIDSASRDATPRWLAQAGASLPVRVCREEVPGIGRARHRALTEARAPLLLFLDDDCTAGAGWLSAHRAAFADPVVVGSGGRILPELPESAPESAPAWLLPFFRDRHGGPGGRFDFGERPLDLPAVPGGDLPFGGNCGLRVAPARAAGGFDGALGWGAPANLPGEESDLMERLQATGGRLRYVPEALARHHLPVEALSARYYLAYYGAIARRQAEREREGTRRHARATLRYRAFRLSLRARLAELAGRRAGALELRRRLSFVRARLQARLAEGRAGGG